MDQGAYSLRLPAAGSPRGLVPVVELELLDVMGRRLVGRTVDVMPGLQEIRVDDARRLAAGVYVVRISHQGRIHTGRVAVLH